MRHACCNLLSMNLKMFQNETILLSFVKSFFAGVTIIWLLFSYSNAKAQQCRDLFQSEIKSNLPVTQAAAPTSSNLRGWNRKNLRLITFNAQDFTLYEKPNSKLERPIPKKEKAAQAIAKTLFDTNPDIIVLQEVGSKYSLQKLAELNKNKDYEAVLIQGHDMSDIKNLATSNHARHIGFLIKKSLNLKYTIVSNLKVPYSGLDANRKYVFDRGLPVLNFFEPGNPHPLFAVIGVHNHSIGEQGKFVDLKILEEQAMMSVIQNLERTYGESFPIIMLGDLNLAVNNPDRLKQIKSKMVECFSDLNVDPYDRSRITQTFQRQDEILDRQVDAVFLSRPLAGHTTNARTLPFPIAGISDHKPLLVDVSLDGTIP